MRYRYKSALADHPETPERTATIEDCCFSTRPAKLLRPCAHSHARPRINASTHAGTFSVGTVKQPPPPEGLVTRNTAKPVPEDSPAATTPRASGTRLRALSPPFPFVHRRPRPRSRPRSLRCRRPRRKGSRPPNPPPKTARIPPNEPIFSNDRQPRPNQVRPWNSPLGPKMERAPPRLPHAATAMCASSRTRRRGFGSTHRRTRGRT